MGPPLQCTKEEFQKLQHTDAANFQARWQDESMTITTDWFQFDCILESESGTAVLPCSAGELVLDFSQFQQTQSVTVRREGQSPQVVTILPET